MLSVIVHFKGRGSDFAEFVIFDFFSRNNRSNTMGKRSYLDHFALVFHPIKAADNDAGADIINDVSFLSNPEFAKICAKNNKKLVIMHSCGDSWTMDDLCDYNNLIDEQFQIDLLEEKLNHRILLSHQLR